MSVLVVRTKEELEFAQKQGAEEILVLGELADNLKRAERIGKASAVLVAALAAAIAAIPFTGGVSTLGIVPIAAMTGFEIAAIVSAIFIGIALLVAIFRDYEEIEYEEGKIRFRKKTKD